MFNRYFEKRVRAFFSAGGIEIGGKEPFEPVVHDKRFFTQVALYGGLGLGESYVQGVWDCEAIDACITRLLRGGVSRSGRRGLLHPFSRFPHRKKSAGPEPYHYDIGDDLFYFMLDKRLIYSCAYWNQANSLDEAQEAKLDLVCRKLGLKPGMHLLDIGCGWGGMLQYAAEHYGIRGTGITLSKNQYHHARQLCKGLDVDIKLLDYRKLKTRFDRIVSIGMFEHVGLNHYGSFFRVVKRCLKRNGLFLLHTIGNRMSCNHMDPWLKTYIFPDAFLPSAKQIMAHTDGLFVLEDWHSFGQDYDRTLMAWYANFETHWDALKGRYGQRFRRMWRYYLLCCAGAFRSNLTQLWQIVFSPEGVPGGYLPAGKGYTTGTVRDDHLIHAAY